jgi:membrane protein implicated in regulation of membrane protease activity
MMSALRPRVRVHRVVMTIAIVLAFFLPSPANVLILVVGAIGEVGEIVWGRRLAKRWRAKTGAEAMIGLRAEVVEECRPDGRVHVRGELWEAHCEAGASVGDPVRVTALEGLTLTVEPGEGRSPYPAVPTAERSDEPSGGTT